MGKINAILLSVCALSAAGAWAEDADDPGTAYLLTGTKQAAKQPSATTASKKNADGSITTTVKEPSGKMTATRRAAGGKIHEVVVTTPLLNNGKVVGSKAVTRAASGAKLGVVKSSLIKPSGKYTSIGYAPNGAQIYTSVSQYNKTTRKTTTVTTYPTGTVLTTVRSANGNYTETSTDAQGNVYYTVAVHYSNGTAAVEYTDSAMDSIDFTTKFKANRSADYDLFGLIGNTIFKANGSRATAVPLGLDILGPPGTVRNYTITPNKDGTKRLAAFNANGRKTIEFIINPDGGGTSYTFDPATGSQTSCNREIPGPGAAIQLI